MSKKPARPIPTPSANGPPKAPGGPKSPEKPSAKVRMPPRAYDAKKPRLPAGSSYLKTWDGEKWTISLTVTNPKAPEVMDAVFIYAADASFHGEAQCDKLYRQWLKEQEGKAT